MVLLTRSLQMLSHYLPCVICTTCNVVLPLLLHLPTLPSSVIRLVQVLPWDRYCSPPNPPPPCESCNPSSCLLAACNHKLLYIQCPPLSNRPYITISRKKQNPICSWWIINKNVPQTLMARGVIPNKIWRASVANMT